VWSAEGGVLFVGRDYELRDRTKQFALRVIRLFTSLPKTTEAQVIGKQLLRSGTSVAANYREACRARSDAELISKLSVVEQELDESALWMELLVESGVFPEPRMAEINVECEELLKMTVASIRTLKSR
jgi:four helix bundle protein